VAGGDEFHLELWHGLGVPLYLSTAILVLGFLLWRYQSALAPLFRLTGRVPEARAAYRRSLRGLFELADRTVSIVQPGSLPIYLGVILLTLVVLPGSVLLGGVPLGVDQLASSPLQLVVAIAVVAAALGTAVVRRRLSTVILLGGVGFGVAVLFVLQGAPDLALTQLLIDTLSIGIFVLVLRRLPENFTQPVFRLGNGVRIVISLAVGGLVTVLALAVTSARTGTGAAAEFLARSLPEGGGKNVVNVILTDFRALDTLGEVTVLAVAAIGVLSMVRANRDDDGAEVGDGADDTGGAAVGAVDDAPTEETTPTEPTAGVPS
jgi:multicomponent Na+:H+ antiporter subunit A